MKKEMTVADLITFLKRQPKDLPVAYRCFSEQVLLGADEIIVVEAGKPRPDGWIQNKRPDKPTQKYLMLPGN